MKCSFILGIILLISGIAYAEDTRLALPEAEVPKKHVVVEGFQKFQFGDEFKKVKYAYPKVVKIDQKNGNIKGLVENVEVIGRRADLIFYFHGDKLHSIGIGFPLRSVASDASQAEFEKVLELLKQKYGDPSVLNQERTMVFDHDITAMKIHSGETTWMARWDSSNGNFVGLVLGAERLRDVLIITYVSRELSSKAEAATKAAQAESL